MRLRDTLPDGETFVVISKMRRDGPIAFTPFPADEIGVHKGMELVGSLMAKKDAYQFITSGHFHAHGYDQLREQVYHALNAARV